MAVFRLREVLEQLPAEDRPSLRRLAQDTGLSYTTVHGIYANRAVRVSLATLEVLAKAVGCTPGDLIGAGKGKARPK